MKERFVPQWHIIYTMNNIFGESDGTYTIRFAIQTEMDSFIQGFKIIQHSGFGSFDMIDYDDKTIIYTIKNYEIFKEIFARLSVSGIFNEGISDVFIDGVTQDEYSTMSGFLIDMSRFGIICGFDYNVDSKRLTMYRS